jgi:hypothetical protein
MFYHHLWPRYYIWTKINQYFVNVILFTNQFEKHLKWLSLGWKLNNNLACRFLWCLLYLLIDVCSCSSWIISKFLMRYLLFWNLYKRPRFHDYSLFFHPIWFEYAVSIIDITEVWLLVVCNIFWVRFLNYTFLL